MARFHHEGELASLSPGSRIELPESIARHLRVLRLREGEAFVLFDGRGGEYAATFAGQERKLFYAELGAHRALERESSLQVTLAQGVSSGERMDLTIQKAVELGVAAIQPLLSGKSVVRLDAERAAAKVLHWQRVAIAACEQCGRNRVPAVAAPVGVADYCTGLQGHGTRILLSPSGGKSLKEALAPGTLGTSGLVLAAGPEGGFDDFEQSRFAKAGFAAVRLGPRVLRTETAAPAALAALNALAGEF
jgi:16S rRNA (uracil1498-N3)-methyltransferase